MSDKEKDDYCSVAQAVAEKYGFDAVIDLQTGHIQVVDKMHNIQECLDELSALRFNKWKE
jgi:hypothetical protein